MKISNDHLQTTNLIIGIGVGVVSLLGGLYQFNEVRKQVKAERQARQESEKMKLIEEVAKIIEEGLRK